MDWLSNNISRQGLDMEMDRLRKQDMEEAEGNDDNDGHLHLGEHNHDHGEEIILADDDGILGMDETARKAAFQALYAKEMARQAELLKLENDLGTSLTSPRSGGAIISQDEESVTWEDA